VDGCRETKRLEIDHVQPRGKLGMTELKNLVRLCTHHHALKTYRGFELKRAKGSWIMVPPKDAKARASPT
jgi:5-methylcytosine-specific restriction endonuclease McrA